MSRLRAETMPDETEPPRPNGLPIAITGSPIRILSESPNLTKGSGLSCFTRSTARSTLVSLPMTSALSLSPSPNTTVISLASPMTWLLVTTMPDGSTTKPEPADCERRCCGAWRSPCWLRRLKNSSNRSPKGVSGPSCGSCGRLRPFWSFVVTAEMLTTAGMTFSTRSASEVCPCSSGVLACACPGTSTGEASSARPAMPAARAIRAGRTAETVLDAIWVLMSEGCGRSMQAARIR